MTGAYDNWLNNAKQNREKLEQAIADKTSKDIIYYRGKYLYALKQAYKIDNSGIATGDITGMASDRYLDEVIHSVLNDHRTYIQQSIDENKIDPNMKDNNLLKELGLKLKRLAVRSDQKKFALTVPERNGIRRKSAKETLSLAGSIVKAPFMITAKVISKVGPLAVGLFALPFKLAADIMNSTLKTVLDVEIENEYDHKIINGISSLLSSAITKISELSYNALARK